MPRSSCSRCHPIERLDQDAIEIYDIGEIVTDPRVLEQIEPNEVLLRAVLLTDDVADPVKTLMSVQLGGGTFIARAVAYAASLVRAPRRAIIVLISDFYEGDTPGALERQVADLCAQGTRVLGLAALDRRGHPAYDRRLAARLVTRGARVGAMTPGELAGWIAEQIRS